MSTMSSRISIFMMDVTLRSTAVLLISATVVFLSRRASAAFRHQVWTVGLISALCLPLLTGILPVWRIPIRMAAYKTAPSIQPRQDISSGAPAPFAVTETHPGNRIIKQHPLKVFSPLSTSAAPTMPPYSEPKPSLTEWLLIAWAFGSILVLAQLTQGLVGLRQIRRKSVPVTDTNSAEMLADFCAALCIRRIVNLRRMTTADTAKVPLTYGTLRPVIVLPSGSDNWPVERLRAALLHELAHIQRGDWPLQIGVQIVRSLYWFHPMVWLAVRQLRQESENACDDLVLASGMTPQEYARQLLDVALCAHARLSFKRDAMAGVVTMAQTRKVEGRLRRILATKRSRREVTSALRGVICLIGGGVMVVAAVAHPVPRTGQAASAQAARSSGPVVGRVITPTGDPAPNVEVCWIERSENMVTRRRYVTVTDSRGQFSFPEGPPSREEDRAVVLMVQAPGWGLSHQSLQSEMPAGAVLSLVLQPPTTLRVSFVDAAGKPLSNIHPRVRTLYDRQRGFLEIPAEMHGRWEQKTDAEGTCVFSGLPQGAQAYFAIEEAYSDPDFSDSVALDKSTSQNAGPIRLMPGAIAQGRVTLADGSPAVGVRVGAQGVDEGNGWGQAISDTSGDYRITHLKSGVYNIAVFLSGELERTRTAVALEKAIISSGTPLRHDFVLIPGAQIIGKVTDRNTGQPIPDVLVGIYGPAHPRSGAAVQSIRTGPDGAYRVCVPAGEQHIYVMGASNRYEPLPEQGGLDVTLQDGNIHTQDYVLTPNEVQDLKPIHVHVVGPDGKAVAKANVQVMPMSKYMDSGSTREIETDADGTCVVQLSPASSPERVVSALLRASSGEHATETAILAQCGDDVTLQLKSGAMVTLSGRVLDDKERPLLNAKVTLIEWRLDSGTTTRTAKTDALGRYSFAGLFPDPRYSVSALAQGFGTAQTNVVQHQAGDKADVGAVSLPRANSVVAGHVVDENGDPVAKQTISVQGMATAPRQVVADEKGRFRIESVVNEELVLYLNNGAGNVANSKHVHAGDTEVILVCKSAHPAAAAANAQDAAAVKLRSALLQNPGPALKAATWLNTTSPMGNSLKGKIVLIDFWATSCGPCVASLPAVQKLSDQLATKKVIVIGLHSAGIAPDALRSFIKEHKLTYPIAIDSPDSQQVSGGETMGGYGVLGIPTVAVLDRSGVVRYLDYGLEGAAAVIGQILASEK